MKGFTKEVKIALVAIVGVIILFFGMNFLKGLNVFSSTDDYYIEFKDISGLSTSSPIYADGFKVGTVKDVIYDYAGDKPTRVLVGLDKAMRIPAAQQPKSRVTSWATSRSTCCSPTIRASVSCQAAPSRAMSTAELWARQPT